MTGGALYCTDYNKHECTPVWADYCRYFYYFQYNHDVHTVPLCNGRAHIQDENPGYGDTILRSHILGGKYPSGEHQRKGNITGMIAPTHRFINKVEYITNFRIKRQQGSCISTRSHHQLYVDMGYFVQHGMMERCKLSIACYCCEICYFQRSYRNQQRPGRGMLSLSHDAEPPEGDRILSEPMIPCNKQRGGHQRVGCVNGVGISTHFTSAKVEYYVNELTGSKGITPTDYQDTMLNIIRTVNINYIIPESRNQCIIKCYECFATRLRGVCGTGIRYRTPAWRCHYGGCLVLHTSRECIYSNHEFTDHINITRQQMIFGVCNIAIDNFCSCLCYFQITGDGRHGLEMGMNTPGLDAGPLDGDHTLMEATLAGTHQRGRHRTVGCFDSLGVFDPVSSVKVKYPMNSLSGGSLSVCACGCFGLHKFTSASDLNNENSRALKWYNEGHCYVHNTIPLPWDSEIKFRMRAAIRLRRTLYKEAGVTIHYRRYMYGYSSHAGRQMTLDELYISINGYSASFYCLQTADGDRLGLRMGRSTPALDVLPFEGDPTLADNSLTTMQRRGGRLRGECIEGICAGTPYPSAKVEYLMSDLPVNESLEMKKKGRMPAHDVVTLDGKPTLTGNSLTTMQRRGGRLRGECIEGIDNITPNPNANAEYLISDLPVNERFMIIAQWFTVARLSRVFRLLHEIPWVDTRYIEGTNTQIDCTSCIDIGLSNDRRFCRFRTLRGLVSHNCGNLTCRILRVHGPHVLFHTGTYYDHFVTAVKDKCTPSINGRNGRLLTYMWNMAHLGSNVGADYNSALFIYNIDVILSICFYNVLQIYDNPKPMMTPGLAIQPYANDECNYIRERCCPIQHLYIASGILRHRYNKAARREPGLYLRNQPWCKYGNTMVLSNTKCSFNGKRSCALFINEQWNTIEFFSTRLLLHRGIGAEYILCTGTRCRYSYHGSGYYDVFLIYIYVEEVKSRFDNRNSHSTVIYTELQGLSRLKRIFTHPYIFKQCYCKFIYMRLLHNPTRGLCSSYMIEYVMLSVNLTLYCKPKKGCNMHTKMCYIKNTKNVTKQCGPHITYGSYHDSRCNKENSCTENGGSCRLGLKTRLHHG